jgi:hypothetical protein
MGTIHLSKFSSQTNPEILNILRQIGDIEGRKFHAVLDEAFRNFLNKKGVSTPDRQVMTSFAQSLYEFEDLYIEIAK